MRDLKQCLMDLLRSGGIGVGDNTNLNSTNTTSKLLHKQQQRHNKPKKLHEYTAADCNKAFLRKYYDVGNPFPRSNATNEVIYFNENLTMTSKYDMGRYPQLNRYPSCPLSNIGNSDDSVSPTSSRSDNHNTDDSELSRRFDYSSSEDDRATLVDCFHRTNALHISGFDDIDGAEDQLDSFCTLCTSSFSYNKCCRYCDNSRCGSQCNSEHTASLRKVQRNPQATVAKR